MEDLISFLQSPLALDKHALDYVSIVIFAVHALSSRWALYRRGLPKNLVTRLGSLISGLELPDRKSKDMVTH